MRIFISYRRTDLAMYLVDAMHAELTSAVGDGNVFLDIDSVPPGVDFRRHIAQAVDEADTVLAVIGPNWQPDRLFQHTDFVRTELLAAAALNKAVIPVLIGGRQMPVPADLPPELEWLVWRNALTVAPPPRDRHDLQRLADHFRPAAGTVSDAPVIAPAARPPSPVKSAPHGDPAVTRRPKPIGGQPGSPIIYPLHLGGALSVNWSPDGRWLASSGVDGFVNILESARLADETPPLHSRLEHGGAVASVCWAPDGSELASGGHHGEVRIWNVDAPSPRQTFVGHRSAVRSVAWSPDGTMLAWAGATQVWLSGLEIGTESQVIESGASAVAWAGAVLAVVGPDVSIRILDGHTRRATKSFKAGRGRLFCATWSPDGRRLCVGGDDRIVRVGEPGRFGSAARLVGHTDYVRAVAWSADGRRIASGGADRSVRLWDSASGQQVGRLSGNTHGVRGLAWSPDGSRIAAAGNDGAIRIWDVPVISN